LSGRANMDSVARGSRESLAGTAWSRRLTTEEPPCALKGPLAAIRSGRTESVEEEDVRRESSFDDGRAVQRARPDGAGHVGGR
jgi:hypothetical protein